MFSAILLWKLKPNLFNMSEMNEQFKRLLNNHSLPKAIILYTLLISLTLVIITVLALFFTIRIVLNQWDFLFALRFAFVFMSFLHLIGTLTNLMTLSKKEIQLINKT